MDFHAFYSGSTANLYRVSNGETPLLIECGVSLKAMRVNLDFNFREIQGCLLSHSHLDHARSAEDIMQQAVDLYTSQGTANTLGLQGHRLHIIEPLKQFSIGSWQIMPFETEHDCEGSLGFLMASRKEKLLFATDTFYIKHKFKGLTHIAIECNYSKKTLSDKLDLAVKNRLYRSHFELENVKKFLQANDLSLVQEIHLLHLSDYNSDAEMFKREIMQATGKPVYVAGE